MGLGIITLFFLLCFTLLYINKTLVEKPSWLNQAAEKITSSIDVIAFWGLVFSVISAILAPLVLWGTVRVLTIFLSDVLLFLMALPYISEHMMARYGGKLPAKVTGELKNVALAVKRHEKEIGYAGAALSFLLFVVLFR